jgi:hypothetical protein
LRKGKANNKGKEKEFGSKIKEKCVERLWLGIYRMCSTSGARFLFFYLVRLYLKICHDNVCLKLKLLA